MSSRQSRLYLLPADAAKDLMGDRYRGGRIATYVNKGKRYPSKGSPAGRRAEKRRLKELDGIIGAAA